MENLRELAGSVDENKVGYWTSMEYEAAFEEATGTIEDLSGKLAAAEMELHSISAKIISDLNERIDAQLRIMAGIDSDAYKYGVGKSLGAFQQAKMIVEQYAGECRTAEKGSEGQERR